MQNQAPQKKEQLLHSIDEGAPKKQNHKVAIVLVYILLALSGIGTGFLLSSNTDASPANTINEQLSTSEQKSKSATDASCPTGTLESGGIDGEGTHKLVRDGGPSQTAYLISSVLDLDEYLGKTVRVCGDTMQAKKAGWLMDVTALDVQ